ncbi:MAG: hypothetical protein NTZ02_01415 [Candidatus Woesearchaeota archaeon]|nr:hypothetical protein [Candidatus Woesearchaeota archaeon]
MEPKKPSEMNLGELVDAMIQATANCLMDLSALNGDKGSPYNSAAEIRQNVIKRYRDFYLPLKEELENREKKYTKK